MYKSEFCEVSYNDQLNIVFVKWKKFCCGNDYREPLLFALDILKTHDGCNYVADTTNGFEDEIDDARWLLHEYIPRAAAESSCKYIFLIKSNDDNLKNELDKITAGLSKYFNVISCFSLDEVKQVLDTLISC